MLLKVLQTFQRILALQCPSRIALKSGHWQRFAEVETLEGVAIGSGQEIALGLNLHPFGNYVKAQVLG